MGCDHPEYNWMVVVSPAENEIQVVRSERKPQQSFIHYKTCGGKYDVMVFRTKEKPTNVPDKDSPTFITPVKEAFNEAHFFHEAPPSRYI